MADAPRPVAFRRVEPTCLGKEWFVLDLHIDSITLEVLREDTPPGIQSLNPTYNAWLTSTVR